MYYIQDVQQLFNENKYKEIRGITNCIHSWYKTLIMEITESMVILNELNLPKYDIYINGNLIASKLKPFDINNSLIHIKHTKEIVVDNKLEIYYYRFEKKPRSDK